MRGLQSAAETGSHSPVYGDSVQVCVLRLYRKPLQSFLKISEQALRHTALDTLTSSRFSVVDTDSGIEQMPEYSRYFSSLVCSLDASAIDKNK